MDGWQTSTTTNIEYFFLISAVFCCFTERKRVRARARANTPAPISFYLKRFFFLSAGDFEIRINLSDCQSMEGYFNFFQQRKGFVKYWFWSFDKLTFFSLRKYLWKFNVVLFQLLGISTISANFSIFLHISYDVVSICFSDLIYPVLWIHWLSICVTEFY